MYAAEHCAPKVRSISKVNQQGVAVVRLRRRARAIGFECRGRVRLRAGSGRRIGAARFKFPYGVRATQVEIGLDRRPRRVTATARVDRAST
jgi:hypothetical protein